MIFDNRRELRRGARMPTEVEAFAPIITAIVGRFFRQHGRTPPPDAESAVLAARLWTLIEERGLPRPLATHERGEPGEMSDEETAPLMARVLAGAGDPLLGTAAKQLVKACFYPEFKKCRDSWCEVAADGACRRQELSRVLGRVSGSHCVDCPHWVALSPEQHGKFLAREWRAGPEEFAAHRDAYLPEDFRVLRRWLHTQARSGGT